MLLFAWEASFVITNKHRRIAVQNNHDYFSNIPFKSLWFVMQLERAPLCSYTYEIQSFLSFWKNVFHSFQIDLENRNLRIKKVNKLIPNEERGMTFINYKYSHFEFRAPRWNYLSLFNQTYGNSYNVNKISGSLLFECSRVQKCVKSVTFSFPAKSYRNQFNSLIEKWIIRMCSCHFALGEPAIFNMCLSNVMKNGQIGSNYR